MFLKAWQFITLVLTTLLIGMSFSHVLEMPGKFHVEASLWLAFQHTLYRGFSIVGGPIEIGAIVSMGVLAYIVRADRASFALTLGATALLIAAFVIWLLLINPVNAQTGAWTRDTIPADWPRWRAQWEYSHAARFAIHILALCALLFAVMSASSKADIGENGSPPDIRRP